MKKKKFYLLEANPYYQYILLAVGTTAQELCDELNRRDKGAKLTLEDIGIGGMAMGRFIHNSERGWCVVWVKGRGRQYLGTLAHELLHATFYTLGRSGIRYSDESEEAYTYLFQKLFGEAQYYVV